MKKVIGKYTVIVYDDGSADISPVTERVAVMAQCSSSIRQIVGIVEYVLEAWKKDKEKNIHYYVTAGVNKVAAEEGVTSSTVHSKILRKLNLGMNQFKELLMVSMENKAPEGDEFVRILRESCKIRRKKGDEDAIEQLIDKIRALE